MATKIFWNKAENFQPAANRVDIVKSAHAFDDLVTLPDVHQRRFVLLPLLLLRARGRAGRGGRHAGRGGGMLGDAYDWATHNDVMETNLNGVLRGPNDAEGKPRSMTFKQLAARLPRTGGTIEAGVNINYAIPGPAFAAHICDVEVDRETGHVKILRYTAIQDVGRAIHPSYVEGQMQGGAVQGIGWALNEEYIYGKDGRLQNPGFLDYRIPVCSDLPMIDTVIVEVANPLHPYGVRGVGEVPIVPPAEVRWREIAKSGQPSLIQNAGAPPP